MSTKKKFWKALTIGSLALAPLFTNGQDIQGYVTDKNSGEALENIIVKAISQNDTTKRQDTLTDFSGFYELNDVVTGINNTNRFSGDKMTITYNEGQMQINVTTNQDIQNGKIYSTDGRTIAGSQFQRMGSNEFQTTINIPEVPEQVLLFSDGIHPAKKIIPKMIPSYGMQTIKFDKSTENNNRLKSTSMTESNNIIFRLDDDATVDEYQPLEIVKSVDMNNTNYIDFQMQKWPEFFANMLFNLQDKYGNIQQNTNMNVKSLDGEYNFDIQTDDNGDAQITNVSIPHIKGNKLIPDSIDFAIEIPANNYLETTRDTLRKVSQGDLIKKYHNLTPKQQDFFANLYATIVSEQTGDSLNNVLTQIWKENSTDTLKLFTNSQGQVSFENININALNEITPDTVKHFLKFSGVDLETKLDSINLTNGNFNQTYKITEKNKYELEVIGKDSKTGIALDSVDVKAFLNGQLLMSKNSLQDTITKLQTTMPEQTLDLKVLMQRAGYISSDSIPVTITEGVAKEVVHNLVKKEVPVGKAYLWREFVPEIIQTGTTTDVVIKNLEFNYNDTIFAVNGHGWWQDTIPVNTTGTTEYEIEYIPHVREGSIPLYNLKKVLNLTNNQQLIGQDTLKSLEQQQKIKGKVVYGDTKTNATYIDLIVRDMDGNTVDSITTTDGYYEFGPYDVGFEGRLDAHIKNTHPNRADTLYFGHKGILIVPRGTNNTTINSGSVIMEDKVTNFEDSVKTYNVEMVPAFWIDAETGELAKVNPAHIQKMDGNVTYDMPMLAFGESNVFFESTTTNKQWLFDMAKRIRDNFGIPFAVNEVENELPTNGIDITSLDTTYLNSVKNQMGINAEVYSGTSGLTYPEGYDELEDVHVHSVTNARIRSPTNKIISPYMVVESERELVHRMLNATNIPLEYYKSIGNSSTPNDLDTTKMVYDHINYSLMDNNRRMRINPDKKERIGTGAYTIRPNDNSDFYSTKTPNELYNEDRWKHWDSTNIPDFNKKFFQ